MLTVMKAYAQIAAVYGAVDPLDQKAVEFFFESTLPSYDGDKQQGILNHLLELTTGSSGDLRDLQSDSHLKLTDRLYNIELDLIHLFKKDQARAILLLDLIEEEVNKYLKKTETTLEDSLSCLFTDDQLNAEMRQAFTDDGENTPYGFKTKHHTKAKKDQ